ncbi:MAG: hypothetical protein RIC30_02235 [Marinoscillum sp.]|uniref:hypothetical protein n=1 Tax=Marinoscillum sp. TaxID=2024838 RepID=UPI0032F80335
MKKLIPLLLLCACQTSEPAQMILDRHRETVGNTSEIRSLSTLSNCVGPEGNYTTYTSSSFTDDYVLFQQDYDYKPNPFYALILDKEEGYGLDENLVVQGPLSKPVIAVLKAHEFHEVMLQPERRYFRMRLLEDTTFFDQKCHQLIASDHLGLPVRLYFDKKSRLMAGISQVNPYKKGEIIQVHFEKWNKKNTPVIFEQLTILQGSETYSFEYEYVDFSTEEIEKITFEKP